MLGARLVFFHKQLKPKSSSKRHLATDQEIWRSKEGNSQASDSGSSIPLDLALFFTFLGQTRGPSGRALQVPRIKEAGRAGICFLKKVRFARRFE
ncbi:Muscarinic Acetylcholine Receptor M3 [Manis pentadactyla]|nr:Muscarinic Acetylcholine Receptor M3 [Manis pentadactyla]